jgi:hypothetical protein
MKPKVKIFQSSANYLNFAISVSIVAILVAILLLAINRVNIQAETVIMDSDLSNMRWQLRELWAHRNATGQSLAFSEIEGSNPLRLLKEHPNNYRGEFAEPPSGGKAIWYFNIKAKRLVYVFSDGSQVHYRLASTAKLGQASLGAMGGVDLVLD